MSSPNIPSNAQHTMVEVCETYEGVERSSEVMALDDFCKKYLVSHADLKNIADPHVASIGSVLALNASHDRVNEHGKSEPFERFMNGTIDLSCEEDWDFVWSDWYGEGFILNIYKVGAGSVRKL